MALVHSRIAAPTRAERLALGAAAATLSSAVNSAKGCTIWKVRDRPRRAAW